MHRNAFWVAFLLIVVGFSVWFVVKAGYDLIHYYQLSIQVPAAVEKWNVLEVDANKYTIQAAFSYAYQEKNYFGVKRVGDSYPNPWAAQKGIERLEKQSWNVWLDPKVPEKGVLNKKFPYKAAVSAAVLLGLVVYFICIGLYVGVKNEQRRQ